jgi:hypothetical protein
METHEDLKGLIAHFSNGEIDYEVSMLMIQERFDIVKREREEIMKAMSTAENTLRRLEKMKAGLRNFKEFTDMFK